MIKEEFTNILIKDKKDNTYKFALARFLLEYVKNNKISDDTKISYELIAENFLRFYWNQIVVYKLKQDFKESKKPKLVSIIENKTKSVNELYDSFFNKKNLELKDELIQDIYKYCLQDVIPRFQREKKQNIYEHNARIRLNNSNLIRYYMPEKKDRYIILKKEAILEIKDNFNLLFETVILEWAKFLEKTNFTPKLIQKIEQLNNPQRNSLQKYKDILLGLDKSVCFYCNTNLDSNSVGLIHIDHFIPWSYIFEDNEWNLVISCKTCNLKKNNSLPANKYLIRLKERNKQLPQKYKVNEDIIDNYYDNCKKAGFYNNFELSN